MATVFYSPQYVLSEHSFDTTRKAAWIADSLVREPIRGVKLLEPAPLTRNQILDVHDPEYVDAVINGAPLRLAESQGFSWDPGLWPMVRASNGGVVDAARTALEEGVAGSLSSGLHHARRGHGAGFCTFNGLAIAARDVLAGGARSVLILDLDAHAGGGTRSLIVHDPRIWQIDVAVNRFDGYRDSGRIHFEFVRDGDDYLPTVRRCLEDADRAGLRFDLCLYNAGMDPFEGCSMGGRPGITTAVLARREEMVFDWCRARQMPVAFVMAGGYVGPDLDREGLVDLHRLTLSCAEGLR
jgi:acetoin utilization deacetylase AcuC-like enzyme